MLVLLAARRRSHPGCERSSRLMPSSPNLAVVIGRMLRLGLLGLSGEAALTPTRHFVGRGLVCPLQEIDRQSDLARVAAPRPATVPLDHAHWKLKPPILPSTSQTSPQR